MLPTIPTTGELKSGAVVFRTRDDDKDHDTKVKVDVFDRNGLVVASMADAFGRFPDHTTKGPFPLRLRQRRIKRKDLAGGKCEVSIAPVGNDTWRFDFDMALSFHNAPTIRLRKKGVDLDEEHRNFRLIIPDPELKD